MEDHNEQHIYSAAIVLQNAGQMLAMSWATRNVGQHLSSMWREKADAEIALAMKSLGFRLVPLTEQKEAA